MTYSLAYIFWHILALLSISCLRSEKNVSHLLLQSIWLPKFKLHDEKLRHDLWYERKVIRQLPPNQSIFVLSRQVGSGNFVLFKYKALRLVQTS